MKKFLNAGLAGQARDDEPDVMIPVTLQDGSTDWLPLAASQTSSWLIVFKRGVVSRCGILTDDPNGDRVCIGAVTLEHALGTLMKTYPALTYDDIVDHMEV